VKGAGNTMAGLKKNGGLGRGLDALLGEYTQPGPNVTEVDVYLIDNNPDQPRKQFDEEKLKELAASVKKHGIVQPIIVKSNGQRYTIVAGERRYRAARMAGLKTVPVVVRPFEEDQIMEIALIENIQRENLNPIEEAAAIRFLMQQHDYTQEEVSEHLGKSRPAIANTLRLLSLPEPVCELIKNGALSSGHGRALAGLENASLQTELAQKAAEENWSVRETERRAKEANEPQSEKPRKKREQQVDPILFDVEETLRTRLATKVQIKGTQKRGKITIEYFNAQDLQHIYDVIQGADQ